MNIFVLNKKLFDDLMIKNQLTNSNVENNTSTFFISINNTFEKENLPYFTNHKNVKVMYFDDTDIDTITLLSNGEKVPVKAFSEEQAKDLFKFIKQNEDKNNCVIHCAAGISRSGAVGTFINTYTGGNWFDFKRKNPNIQPNSRIIRMLEKASNTNI